MVSRLRFFSFALVILILSSCKEETRVNHVEGFLYYSCGEPLSDAEVAFKANSGSSFTEPLILATDVTEPNGYFNFTYELEEDKKGNADLILVESTGYTTLIEALAINEDHVLDAYVNNETSVTFTYTGAKPLTANDTLYYGIQGGVESYKVQADTGYSNVVKTKLPSTLNPKKWVAFYFGVGLAEFNLSKEALSIEDSTYNHRWMQVSGCGDSKSINLWVQ